MGPFDFKILDGKNFEDIIPEKREIDIQDIDRKTWHNYLNRFNIDRPDYNVESQI